MKTSSLLTLAIAVAGVATSVEAQQPSNPIWRNNQNWLWVSTASFPGTTNRLMPAELAPTEYKAALPTTVPAGTKMWRWIPVDQNNRRETRQVTGFSIGAAPSASTTSFPLAGYRPETTIVPTKPRTGGGLDPDFSMPALVTLPKGSQSFPQYGFYVVTTQLSAPVSITATDIIIATRWEGGENEAQPNTQTNAWGSYGESQYNPITWGYATPAGVVSYPPATALTTQTFPYMNEFEAQAQVQGQSSWGRQNFTFTPSLFGYGLGTGQAPLATQSGMLGWDVHAGALRSGAFAVPLMNVSPLVQPFGLPFLGITLEVNPGDPAFTALASAGYLLQLDTTGFGDGAELLIPVLGSGAIGVNIGVEFAIVDIANGVVDSTQSYWTKIDR